MTVYCFDEFRLDSERGSLIGPGGTPVVLRPKVFALLCHLLERPGVLHTREDLLEALWPDAVVTDDSLTQCISDLRRGLGHGAARVLRTVPRRGYILSAAVQHEIAVSAAQPLGRTNPIEGQRDTIAVEPFASDRQPASIELAAALTSDVTAELTRFEELQVLIGGSHEPAYRIVGEIRRAGPVLRGMIRLETMRDGGAVWVERLEHPAADPAGLPLSTVVALAARITTQVDQASLRRARTQPAVALTGRELCLLGRDVHQRGTRRDTLLARDLFARAGAADPSYAAARAWEAFTEMRTVTHGWAEDEAAARARALTLARQAVAAEPSSPLCLSSVAFALAIDGQWDEAIEMAQSALTCGRPADYGTRTSCAEVLAAAGLPEEAAHAVREAFALDPHSPPRAHAVLGRALVLAQRPQEALPELRRCMALMPDYAPSLRTMVVAAVETGHLEEAAAALRKLTQLAPDWVPGGRPVFWFLRRREDLERFQRAFSTAARYAASDGNNVVCLRSSKSH